MTTETTNLAVSSSAAGTITASASFVATAPETAVSTRSLLRCSIEQALAGDFTLYVGDIITIAGIAGTIVGISLTVYRTFFRNHGQ